MGFAVWIEENVAWAEGTHEYRPMGAAVVSATSQFTQRDFRPGTPQRTRSGRGFAGFFGSLVEVNAHLRLRRRNGASAARPYGRALPFF